MHPSSSPPSPSPNPTFWPRSSRNSWRLAASPSTGALALGATEIAFGALREGAIDIYPEYTGTALAAILGEEMQADAEAVYRRVAGTFRERWDARWLAPLGFENTYAIAVPPRDRGGVGLATLSDLAREAGGLRAGFTPDFIGRSDGLPGLRAAYGFQAAEVLPLLQAVKYEALVESGVDVIDGYSTDGLIARYDLVVLEDDRGFFPPTRPPGSSTGISGADDRTRSPR